MHSSQASTPSAATGSYGMGLSCCSKTAIRELAAGRILSVGRRFAPSSAAMQTHKLMAMMAATELGLSESAIEKAPAPNGPVPSDAVIAKVQGWPARRAQKISAQPRDPCF